MNETTTVFSVTVDVPGEGEQGGVVVAINQICEYLNMNVYGLSNEGEGVSSGASMANGAPLWREAVPGEDGMGAWITSEVWLHWPGRLVLIGDTVSTVTFDVGVDVPGEEGRSGGTPVRVELVPIRKYLEVKAHGWSNKAKEVSRGDETTRAPDLVRGAGVLGVLTSEAPGNGMGE